MTAINPFTAGPLTFFAKNVTKNFSTLGGRISQTVAKCQKPDYRILEHGVLCETQYTELASVIHASRLRPIPK